MPNHQPAIEQLFQAMADPTRIAVLQQLSDRPASVTELAAPFDMALPSFMQHLQLLEKNALVSSEKKGRSRIYRLQPATLARAENWLEQRRSHWEKRLDQLDDYLKTMEE